MVLGREQITAEQHRYEHRQVRENERTIVFWDERLCRRMCWMSEHAVAGS